MITENPSNAVVKTITCYSPPSTGFAADSTAGYNCTAVSNTSIRVLQTGVGSGGNYALAAAKALLDSPHDAEAIARRAMDIAADICIYTNHNVVVETIGG